ncbi:glutaredoxin [Acrasis kona]|uniref:Glutaredoxin n=1 Tax=Acrasis kona TaxID=1008807 RepID=A0AAW2ZRN0_9EUKA
MTQLTDIRTQQEYNDQVLSLEGPSVVHFWAAWCDLCGDMDKFLVQLKSKFTNVNVFRVEAEALSDITEKYSVAAVPAFLFLHNKGTVDSKLEGANPAEIAKRFEKVSNTGKLLQDKITPSATQENIDEKIKRLINQSPVQIFIKGTPTAPQCGFSRQLIEILNKNQVEFGYFNIFTDEKVRSGIKTYSNWPTFPQVYAKGNLVGGLDIIKELEESGDLHQELGVDKKEPLKDKLVRLVNQSKVVLFMKGEPDQPKCGFSRKTVELLKKHNTDFTHFDILQDQDVREGLKTFSNWPTYPQLYVKGELIGGLDILQELDQEGELVDVLSN